MLLLSLATAGAVVCAIGAVAAKRLLSSALWLAGASALVAVCLYLLGAPEIAVVELSVGAGLVTVLFVFAINLTGDEPLKARAAVPRPLAWVLVALAVGLLAWLDLPRTLLVPAPLAPGFAAAVWQQRGLDALLQVALIFAGVLGVLGLLSESGTPGEEAHP
jgi:NADH:ubiquinone oxidoreductase subunit 6 (subunit J)